MPTPVTAHFTLEELTLSQTAMRKGIDNTPTRDVCTNLEALCENVLERIRDLVCVPIVISSGYRSVALNRRIGGARNSQHVRGEAADITCPYLTQSELFRAIASSGILLDQLIDEFESWVHVSYSRGAGRGQRLRARRVDGKTIYTPTE